MVNPSSLLSPTLIPANAFTFKADITIESTSTESFVTLSLPKILKVSVDFVNAKSPVKET